MKRSCPNEEMLASYVEGQLPEEELSQMEAHLSLCDKCREEFKLTNQIVRGGTGAGIETAPPEVTRSAVRLVNDQNIASNRILEENRGKPLNALRGRLLQYLRSPVRYGWNFAPVRGNRKAVSDDLFRIKKRFGELDTEIEIEKTGEDTAHIRVTLFGRNGCGKEVRVTLKRGERELCSSLFNGGRVLFEDISFGSSKLIFDRNGVHLGVYLFDIKETRNGKERP